MRMQKMKWTIKHPYSLRNFDITVDIEGETLKGVPHGLCFINFIYNDELDKSSFFKPPKGPVVDRSDPYLDG